MLWHNLRLAWHELIMRLFEAHFRDELVQILHPDLGSYWAEDGEGTKIANSLLERHFSKAADELALIYGAIKQSTYTFPEFESLPKEQAMEMSLKAHSVVLRFLRLWRNETEEEGNDSSETKVATNN